jgi:Protein NO VEIN, C-terminal
MSGEEWSELENDAIVADYFSMLSDELVGVRYNKAAHNRSLQEMISRSKGSIEFKHQNISAVLKGLGETWINGYKPAFNFQMSLVDAVARHLQKREGWLARPASTLMVISEAPGAIWVSTPPTLQNTPPPEELEQMQAVARKFDVAGRDERNRSLGKAGEERVLHHERAMLASAGRQDLARKVRWVSQEDGDGAGYDISSFTPEGENRLIEVKTTNGWERTPFHISKNELAVADSNRDSWTLFRLWNFAREPRAFELRPPLDTHVDLTATSFQASFH